MFFRRLFAPTAADEAANIRASIERENKRNLQRADTSLRPAGLGDFERGLYRRHVIREEVQA